MSNPVAGIHGSVAPSDPTVEFGNVDGVPNSVLRIIVENMLYPITIDVLYLVCVLVFESYCVSRVLFEDLF